MKKVKHILHVDNNPSRIRTYGGEFKSFFDANLDVARNHEEAISKAKENVYDLCVLNDAYPSHQGGENVSGEWIKTYQFLKDINSQAHVVLMTNTKEYQFQARTLELDYYDTQAGNIKEIAKKLGSSRLWAPSS